MDELYIIIMTIEIHFIKYLDTLFYNNNVISQLNISCVENYFYV